ncbi:MAG: hypothetical protein H7Y22_02320 [Gemmatimonadaceae bacterium]|nr:hypothetical protein [Gloeobacterales cyanobacterium ES-bin-141]
MLIDKLPSDIEVCIALLRAADEQDGNEGFRELIAPAANHYHRLREAAEYLIDEDTVEYAYPGLAFEVSSSSESDFAHPEDYQEYTSLEEAYSEWMERCVA